MSKIEKIIDLCDNNDIEIVSYGLAPNPNGFCFERDRSTSATVIKKLNNMLDGLSTVEVAQLRKEIFG